MNDILVRIRKIFNDSGESQTEIGKKIKKTSQYVWKILNDDNANPSESVIADICREFSINENWIKFGEEPMKISHNAKLSSYLAEIPFGNDEFIKELIEVYMDLDQTSKDALKLIADKMVEKRNNKK